MNVFILISSHFCNNCSGLYDGLICLAFLEDVLNIMFSVQRFRGTGPCGSSVTWQDEFVLLISREEK